MDAQPTTTRRDVLKLAAGAASVAALGAAGLPTAAHASAPMLGALRPTIYRFKLGNFEVTQHLRRLHASRPSLHPTYGANQPARR